MSLSRQQKRAMFRRLNDLSKMNVVMDRIEKEFENNNIEKKDNVKQRISTAIQWTVIISILAYFVFK